MITRGKFKCCTLLLVTADLISFEYDGQRIAGVMWAEKDFWVQIHHRYGLLPTMSLVTA